MNKLNKELEVMIEDFFQEKLRDISLSKKTDWFMNSENGAECITYMQEKLGLDTQMALEILESAEVKHIENLKRSVFDNQRAAEFSDDVVSEKSILKDVVGLQEQVDRLGKKNYENFLGRCNVDMISGLVDFNAKEQMQKYDLNPKSVAQDLFNDSKEYSEDMIDDPSVQRYCKKELGVELDLVIANKEYSKKNENEFEQKTSNIFDRIGNIKNFFTAGQDKNKDIEKSKIFDDFLEQQINKHPFIERADKFLNIERKELNNYIREKFVIYDDEMVNNYSSELQKKVELAEQKHFEALKVAIVESQNPEDIEKFQKDIEALEFTRATYCSDEEELEQAPSKIDRKIDSILNRTEKIENEFVNQEDVKVAIEAIDRRTEDILLMVDELEKKAAIYKEEGLGLDSLEVKELLKACEAINTETMGLKEKYEKIQTLPVQDVAINTQETENLSDVMQVIVLNEKGFYKELSSELNPDKFLSSFEVEKMAEGLSKEYPESKLMMIEVDRKKYTGIEGLSFEIAGRKDKMLKEEGVVKFECKIPKEQKEQKEAGKEQKGTGGKTKIDEALKKVVAKEERNAIEIAWNWTKLIGLLIWNFGKGIYKFFEPAPKAEPIPSLKSKPETIQVLALEQVDGKFNDIRTEMNPSLFMDAQELKPYVDELTKVNGKYILMEIPKNEFPSVNLYLKDGIMTDEGKKKYQEAKSEFLKGYSKDVVAYEVSDRPEIKPEIKSENKSTIDQQKRDRQTQTQQRNNHHKNPKGRGGRGGKRGRR